MEALLKTIQTYLTNSQTAETVFVLLTGAAVFVFALAGFAFVLAVADPLRRRLGQLAGDEPESPSRVADWIRPFARYATPSKELERSRVGRLLMHAGYRSPQAATLFYATKALLSIGLPAAVFAVSPFFPRITTTALLFYACGAALLGSLAPSMWLDHKVKSRQLELRASFPDALDLLVV